MFGGIRPVEKEALRQQSARNDMLLKDDTKTLRDLENDRKRKRQ